MAAEVYFMYGSRGMATSQGGIDTWTLNFEVTKIHW